jgi:hypothetical protein
MARDHGLEEIMRDHLADIEGLIEKPMFGGWAWLSNGHLLCGARDDGALFRLGKGNDADALARPGVEPMISRGRIMSGWVRVEPIAFADDAFARQLLKAALRFVETLPRKH